MFKFFRRYKKFLLVGFGIFLMIAFLLPSGLSRMHGNPNERTVMTVAGRSVSFKELTLAAKQREAAISLLGPIVQLGGDRGLLGLVGANAEHWLLMGESAKRAGLLGQAGDGEAFATQLSDSMVQGLWQQALNEWFQAGAKGEAPKIEELLTGAQNLIANLRTSAGRRAGLTSEEMNEVLARLAGIQRMQALYLATPRMSAPRLQIAAARDLAQVEVKYVTVPGDRLAGTFEEPDSLTLAGHFAQYRDQKRTENELGVGYVLPPRVKLEWITLDYANFAAAAYVSDIQVRARYEADPARYGADREAAESAIRAQMRDEAATAMVREGERIVRSEVLRARSQLATDGMFRVIPENWTAPSFEAIAGRVLDALLKENDERSPRWMVDPAVLKRPVVVRRESSWLTRQDVVGLPAIGNSNVRVGGRPRPFADVVLSVHEINPDTDLPLQTRLPAIDMPARDDTGSEYIYTVLDARKESPADGLEDVREMAANDYLSIQGFRALEGEISELREVARVEGLEAVARRYENAPSRDGALPQSPLTVLSGRVTENYAPDVLSQEGVKEAILARARELDPLQDPAEYTPRETILVLAAPKSRAIVAVQIVRVQPATMERYRASAPNQAMSLAIRELTKASEGSPLPFEAGPVKKRLGVERRGKADDEDETEGESSGE